jgi:dTMP kinase
MPPAMPGKFIVFDGPDYCGKDTQWKLIDNYLADHPLDRENKLINVVRTREPFNTKYTLEARRIMRESKDPKQRAVQLKEIFFADRWEHVYVLILPMVKAGCIVLDNRYKYATEAYQSAQGLDINELVEMHNEMPVPDITFLLKIPIEETLKRKAAVKGRPYEEVFEKDQDFIRKVQEQYDLLVNLHSNENIVVIDGNRPKEAVFEDIKSHVDKLIFNK